MEVERGDIFQVTASNAGVGTAEEENIFEHIHCSESVQFSSVQLLSRVRFFVTP